MLEHLIKVNKLEPVMEKYGLEPEEDLHFITEMIAGKKTDPEDPEVKVCTMTLPQRS